MSDVENAQQQTATQYNGGRQDLYAIIDSVEDELAAKYEDCAAVFAHIAAALKIPGAPTGKEKTEELFIIKWNDDQTRKDIQQAKQTALQEIAGGVKNKWEYRVEFYGEDEATAKANVPPEPEYSTPFDLA